MADEVLAPDEIGVGPGGESGDDPGDEKVKEPPDEKIVVIPPLSSLSRTETKFGDAILGDGASSMLTSTEVSEVRMRS